MGLSFHRAGATLLSLADSFAWHRAGPQLIFVERHLWDEC